MFLLDTEECVHMDVLCLRNHLDFILAGIGSSLLVYENSSLKLSHSVFPNERIHSIYTNQDFIFIKGGKELALIKLKKTSEKVICQNLFSIKCSDWIQDVIVFNKYQIGLTTAHNFFEIWDLNSKQLIKSRSCNLQCILYSCKTIGTSIDNVLVLAGTIFGDILIWSPVSSKEENILQRFQAHNGAVFSIEVSIAEKIIATTSDDRSLRIWHIHTLESLLYPDHWRNSQIQLLHTLFGHTARVWKCLIISSFYVTIGEDSQLIIWKRDGTLLKKLSLHQESGIRGLCFSEKADQIITGGEDGGINEISWNYLMFKCNPFLQGELINTDKTFSTRVCFVKQGYVYTTNGGCVLVNGRKEEFIYKNENFLTYCFLEVSLTGDFVALGSIKGQLVIIDVLKKIVLIDGQYLDGRVYSIHYLDNHLLTCGPQGRLDLWRVSNFALNHVKVLSLPVCKERWTNCALLQNNHLIVGDRMGNIHFYNLNGGEEPVQICRKIHSYLGVSDALDDGNAIFTIGRDGTLKTFTKSLVHSNTYKLPIEWPWKIVNYKGDKLILGFHSINFVVWSMKHREIIASQECGGGHRSCHYVLNGDKLSFIFVKEKKIFLIDLTLNAINRLRIGFHGKVINSLRIINSEIIVTGSEDTTLRISRISKIEIEVLDVLKTHISSVRAIGSCFFEDGKILIVSGGGKAQIVLWRFDVNSLKCEELISFRLKKEDRSWKCETPMADPETRFMCIDILKQKKEFFIAAGCSDCKLRLFLFNESLNLLSSISYSHCILKVAILKVSLAIYLVSMATDGKVVFWQVTESLNVIMSGAFSIHQSGINCFAFEEIDVGKFILATGGDDNKISVSEIRFMEGGVKLNQLWNNSTTHSCQITGVKILNNILITASIDQRITLWKWSYTEGVFEILYEDQRIVAVPDIQGMDAKWCSSDKILVAIHGKGIQTLKVDVG